MSTLIIRKTSKISIGNDAVIIALAPSGAAKQRPARTVTAQGQADRPRFVAALLHALSTWTA